MIGLLVHPLHFLPWWNTSLRLLNENCLFFKDLQDWVQGRPEVEVVDMALTIKNKINKCTEHNIPVTEATKEQLNHRLNDIVNSLPEDLKNILKQDS